MDGGGGLSLDVDMGLHPLWAWSLSLGRNSVPSPALSNESLEICKQENDRRGRFYNTGGTEERSLPLS